MTRERVLSAPSLFFLSVDVAPAKGRSASVAHDSERSTRDRFSVTFFNNGVTFFKTDRTFLICALSFVRAVGFFGVTFFNMKCFWCDFFTVYSLFWCQSFEYFLFLVSIFLTS